MIEIMIMIALHADARTRPFGLLFTFIHVFWIYWIKYSLQPQMTSDDLGINRHFSAWHANSANEYIRTDGNYAVWMTRPSKFKTIENNHFKPLTMMPWCRYRWWLSNGSFKTKQYTPNRNGRGSNIQEHTLETKLERLIILVSEYEWCSTIALSAPTQKPQHTDHMRRKRLFVVIRDILII